MTDPFAPIPITYGTVGLLQRQTRQLFNTWPIPDDRKVNERAVGFCQADRNTGVLPELLGTQAWMYLEEDSDEDPVLVLAAMEDGVALYVVANLNERATVAALATAVNDRKIELVVASPGGLTSHWLLFSSSEAKYLDDLLAEYLDYCHACDPDWMEAFKRAIPRLPRLCHHLNPALLKCERHRVIVLQGSYDNHLRAVHTALRRRTSF
jgi:hypothetical protein